MLLEVAVLDVLVFVTGLRFVRPCLFRTVAQMFSCLVSSLSYIAIFLVVLCMLMSYLSCRRLLAAS